MPAAPRPPIQPKPLRALDYIDRLALEGRFHFTTEQAAEALGPSEIAARAAVRRLKKRGAIAAPMRGFHVLVSPEHRAAGCPPAEQFVGELMRHVGAPYYAALLTAASYYGATAERPDAFQVVTVDNRVTIQCGKVRVAFVAKQNAALVATREFPTPRGPVQVSSPEATALDLCAYPIHAGGLSNVSLVLLGLAEQIDAAALVDAAALAEMPAVQRLGYLLDRVAPAELTDPLAAFVASKKPIATPLDPRRPKKDAPRDARWRLDVNADV